MSQPTNPAYQKSTWLLYIDTVLFEAQLETSQTQPDPASLKNIDLAIRPFLFLTSAGLKYTSKHPIQEEDGKKTRFQRFTSKLVASTFRAQLQAANISVRRTEEWANKAANLFSWHLSLCRIEHPLTKVSTSIQELIKQVQAIDDIRAHQVNNRFRAGLFISGGTTCWLIGAFAAVGWMATAGKVMLVATTLYYGAIWVWHLSDPKIIEQKYKQITKLGNQIKLSLPYYDDSMRLPIDPPKDYTPDLFQKKAYPTHLNNVIYQDFAPTP